MGFIASSLLVLNACTDKVKYEDPKQLIPTDLAIDLSKRYHNERAPLITSNIGKDDATAVWYSIEELENYINYVKTQGSEKGIDVTGIRMYMGVYPTDTSYGEKSGLTTIFLSPTKKKAINIKNTKSRIARTLEENIDATELQPLNYGGIGHPPKVVYPQ